MSYVSWAAALLLVTAILYMLAEANNGLAVAFALLLLVGVFYREMPSLRARFQF